MKNSIEKSTRICPDCGKILYYTGKSARKNCKKHEKNKTVCRRCSKVGHIVSEKTKEKISLHRKGKCIGKDNGFYGKKHKNEFIIKMRLLRLGQIGNRAYNKKACKLFNTINKEMNWNGVHAENGGEYVITPLGYVVDYYEPNLNLVIEFDEAHHNRTKQKIKDKKRQKEIIDLLKCKFIRIKEKDKKNWRKLL